MTSQVRNLQCRSLRENLANGTIPGQRYNTWPTVKHVQYADLCSEIGWDTKLAQLGSHIYKPMGFGF